MQVFDIAVAGAGPAGLAAALSLLASGARVALIAPDEAKRPPDRRTTALLGDSLNLLRNLGVWARAEADATPLEGIRLVDDSGGLFRAPEITFHASELGLTAFGANIANGPLVEALLKTAAEAPALTRVNGSVSGITPGSDAITVHLRDGKSFQARLLVAADGRNSMIRKASGISVESRSYPQSALAVSFKHAKPHRGVSTELHRRHGPLTSVPLQGLASSLVWVEAPDEAARLAALDDDAFCEVLEGHLQGLLGRIHSTGPRGVFPLSVLTAELMGRNRVALVGEAAHVMPPIGAQGLNLGFRDAAALAEIVADQMAKGSDPGSQEALQAYHRARFVDVVTRQVSIDLLNRSLLSDFLPPHALRGAGLHLLANIKPLRELVMRSGMGPHGTPPRLMRSEAEARA
jgi:2-octaprenyl-6-methoxyphenol hydroxylase